MSANASKQRRGPCAISCRSNGSTRSATMTGENPKRIYYMSMEFLIGRSLSNNIANLMLHPLVERALRDEGLDVMAMVDQEPDAGLGNGGLGAARRVLPRLHGHHAAPGHGLRATLRIRHVQPVDRRWLAARTAGQLASPAGPLEISRRSEAVEVKLAGSFEMHHERLRVVPNRPSVLVGVPYDRPIVGFGGRTINSLRLWNAAAHDTFDFQEFSTGDFVGALVEGISAQTVTRVLYPD